MTSISSLFSYKNLSFCIYIGNTTSIDDQTLFNYCSRFGTILPTSISQEKFCDFHIIEYSTHEQSQRFLNQNHHQIDRIQLDVRSYKHILTHHDILNIDRKFYIGPISNPNDERIIVQFYKTIDPTLRYYSSEQEKQVYLLFEFNNRQLITTIFERQTMPIGNEHRKCSLYKPMHPKQFVNRIISMKNKRNQINVHGLTDHITEAILTAYFHKRAPVIACHILTDDSKSAIVEFNDRKTVGKILETCHVCLQGANLSSSQAARHLASLLSLTDNNDETEEDEEDEDDDIKVSPSERNHNSLRVQNHPPSITISSTRQTFVIPTASPVITEPIRIPSPENNGSGWSSPPRTIITQSPPIDRPASRTSSNSGTTTNSNHTESTSRLTTIDPDVKPIRSISSNNLQHFAEQIEVELDQIRNEYKSKFEQNRVYIEQEINVLINEERQAFDQLNRYLIDHRRRIEKRNQTNNHKRKFSPSSSTH